MKETLFGAALLGVLMSTPAIANPLVFVGPQDSSQLAANGIF